MKSVFRKRYLLMVLIGGCYTFVLSCDTGDTVKKHTPDNASVIAPEDTSMPQERVSPAASTNDSLTPDARHAPLDSLHTKIALHKGKVREVDTVKK